MIDDIIDQINGEKRDNRSWYRILLLSALTIFIYFIIEKIRPFFPPYLLEEEDVKIGTFGLVILGVIIINSILIPTYLNKSIPKLKEITIVLYTGLVIFGVEVIFKVIQGLILGQNALFFNVMNTLTSVGIVSILAMLIANIRIHKLRGHKIITHVLLMIGVWIFLALVV